MGRRRKGERVLGPYEDGSLWQVIVVDANRRRRYRRFETRAAAEQYVGLFAERITRAATTIHEALDAYERYLSVEKGNKPKSWKETMRRLRVFIPERAQDLVLDALPEHVADGWYRELVEARDEEGRPVYAVDSHRNYLAEARSFFKWCILKRWLSENPLANTQGEGRRRHGKDQLRIDEARKWMAKACELADQGEDGAVAALMTLLLGMRASEVVSRQVRDVDDEGRLLWIPSSKTEAGRRKLEVPEVLRPRLLAVVDGRPGDQLLFRGRTGKGRGRAAHRDRKWPTTWVQTICELAGVPVITSHGMRGLHGTLAVDAGLSPHLVAASLGHESFSTTETSYAKKDTVAAAKRRKGISVLQGGKKGEP